MVHRRKTAVYLSEVTIAIIRNTRNFLILDKTILEFVPKPYNAEVDSIPLESAAY